MAVIQLSEGFQVPPEGVYTFKIVEAKFDTQFQEVKLKLKTGEGYTDREQYSLINSDGTPNEAALGAFSYLARCAMDIPDLSDIDPEKLVGHFIKATVTHSQTESKKTKGRMLTFANLSEIETGSETEWNAAAQIRAAQGQTVSSISTPPVIGINAAPRTAAGFDLDALFGKKKN